jgi:hypothetical protein
MQIKVDDLAQEIRRVDGSNSLGAGALAEALIPFLTAALALVEPVEPVAWWWNGPKGGFLADNKKPSWPCEPLSATPPPPVDADAIIERCAQAVKSAPLGEELRAIRALQGQVIHD